MLKSIPVIFFALLLFISCNDKSSDPITDDTFLVDIKVVDGQGNPVPDINISTWNKLPYLNQTAKRGIVNQIAASSFIDFWVKEESFVSISLYDLDRQFIKYIISPRNFEMGLYELTYNFNETTGTAVYKLVMNASTDSTGSSILFRDSIYITLWQSDPQYSLVGKTNEQGELKIENKMLFPHLYNPPPVPHTSAVGPEILGYFTIPDTVTIALSDSSYSTSLEYHKLIIDGKNEFTLIWEKNSAESSLHKQNTTEDISGVILDYFYAETVQNNVFLHWGTLEEENNRGFEVQRMSGTSWSAIGFVTGSGTTTEPQVYVFADNDLLLGSYNYRLKQVQFDGSFSYSQVIDVNVFNPLEWRLFQNYPNPFN